MIGDYRCEGCGSKELRPFMAQEPLALCVCRKCVGKLVAAIVGYIRDFDRDKPPRKVPRNPELPIQDDFGHSRCRRCETQMNWAPGMEPYCEGCTKTQPKEVLWERDREVL